VTELATLGSLLLVVAFGAVLPIVPTGAAVSGVAALMFHEQPWLLVLAVVAGAAGAYAGDLVVYAACRAGGQRLARRLRWLSDDGHHLDPIKERLQRAQVPVLLVSRLLPGGRIPVLLAAAFVGLDWRTFVVANLPACALWSLVYAAIGVAGSSIFPEPWQGVVAALILVLLVTEAVRLVRKRRAGINTSDTAE
jgi:membrane protein DedA with SNARE-associated domain